jgi:hypothetical protein
MVFLPPALLRSNKFLILRIFSPRTPIQAFAFGLAFFGGAVFLLAGAGCERSSATGTMLFDW